MMSFGGQMFDAHMEPPKVPPRKEKRPKVKQDAKGKPHTESTRQLLSPAHHSDRFGGLDTGVRADPEGRSAQDKLQRERLRILAGASAGSGPSQPSTTRAASPAPYHSTSPSPTSPALPLHSPSHHKYSRVQRRLVGENECPSFAG
ncbi:unnamed protein product [Peniophora sp. CBMAI 1063]|nr:unnamed protein product [Peniophora sp. CBMAI 1063]